MSSVDVAAEKISANVQIMLRRGATTGGRKHLATETCPSRGIASKHQQFQNA